MKHWKVWFGYRNENGYREEASYVDATSISAAAKNATKALDEKKARGLFDAYMITDIGLVGDPNKEVC